MRTTRKRPAHATGIGISLPTEMVREMRREGQRLQRSVSWVVKTAWLHAREHIAKTKGPGE